MKKKPLIEESSLSDVAMEMGIINQKIQTSSGFGLTKAEKIERWEWIASRWKHKDMMKVVNLLIKSNLIEEKHGVRVSKANINKVRLTLNENSLIVHQCLTNLIIDTLEAKTKLKPSEKKLLREIRLAYRLLYTWSNLKRK